MPTPRQHGGAALVNFPLTAPAFKGLNTSAKNSILGPEWATKLKNTVIDGNGRLAARKGWTSVTGTPHSSEFVQMIEYRAHSGTVELIATTATEVMRSTDNGDTWVDVTGTAVFTSGNWQLQNFNDEVIGFQTGETPLRYNGTTSSQITDGGSEPSGGVGLSAFGRVWAVDSDGTTLQYSALLDFTDWSSADAGSFDLTNVWPGTDTVQALAEYNGALVVFGARNILFFVDGSGSALGLDPTVAYVVDSINGLGCRARDSVQNVGGDIWFLGNDYNIYSLERVIQEKSAPLMNISSHISDDLRDSITLTGHNIADLRSVYSPEDRFYLLFLSRESAAGQGDELGLTWVFDTRGRLEGGSARCMGQWTANVAVAVLVRDNGDVLWSLRSNTGEVGSNTGSTDDGSSYSFDYESGWNDLTEESFLLMIKRLTGLFFVQSNTNVVLKYGYDFTSTLTTRNLVFPAGSVGAEWGVGEWGIGEFSGGVTLLEKHAPGSGSGEFIKIGAQATIDGAEFSMQQIDLYAKVGRLK